MSSTQEPPEKRPRRVSKPKVRTGCVTCKIRRVKCDEGKPECLRCTSTGRKCDGYLPPKTWLFELKSEREAPSDLSLSGSSFLSAHNLEERQALRFYREKTAPTISNYYSPSRFWKVTVLSAAEAHQSVKHITIALAALHEGLEELTDQPGPCRLRFMQNYSKAVSLITKDSTSLALEVVLICCLLFSACETFQGESKTGLLHIEGGARILREWRSSVQGSSQSTTTQSDIVEQEIAPLVEGLESQIVAYRNGSSGDRQTSPSVTPGGGSPYIVTPTKPSLPDQYDTFCKARDDLNELIQWLRRSLSWDDTTTTTLIIDRGASTDDAKCLLSQWLTAFNSFKPQPGGMHEKEFLRKECLLLRAHHRAATIMADCFSAASESSFDGHLGSFQTLLEECSAAAIPSTAANINFHFGFSIGILPPLFLLATRCRDPPLRKEAVAVLRSMHRSEGCWDSCSASLIAEHIINIEERGLTIIQSAADVTPFSRLRLIGAEVAYVNQELVLRVARHPFHGLERPSFEEERIPWPSAVGQERDMVEWASRFRRTNSHPDDFAFLAFAIPNLEADGSTSQPVDQILGAVGYQGLIRPERGICRHTAVMGIGGDAMSAIGEVEGSDRGPGTGSRIMGEVKGG